MHHRALCPVEKLYVGQRSRAVLSCTLNGRVDTKALTAAYDTVTQADPTLRSRIVTDGAGHALALLDGADRPRLETRTGEPTEAYATELNRPLTVCGPLSRAVLVTAPNDTEHLFVLVVDHTVTDGHSSITLLNTLWDHYRSLITDDEPTSVQPDAPAWPEPVSALLPPADEADTATYLDSRITHAKQHPVELMPYDVVPLAGPGEGAHRGVPPDPDRGRHHGAAQDRPQGRRLRARADSGSPAEDGPSPPGGRGPPHPGLHVPRGPALPPDARAAAVRHGPSGDNTPADLGSSGVRPLNLARTVHKTLTDSLASGAHFHEMRITPEIPRNPALQLATVIVTNMGVVPGPHLSDDLRATEVRLVPAREHYFPQAGRSPLMACVVSFEGRLSIEFPHHTGCFSPSFMRAFRDEARDGLLALASAD